MNPENLACPNPFTPRQVLLAHGGGGLRSRELLRDLIEPLLGDTLDTSLESAPLELPSAHLAFTTDSFVVSPLFFPGGDIGQLAVVGTLNDLAMAGARPHSLSLGLILEEGLPMDTLRKIVASIGETARRLEAPIRCGDTKVVERGKGDGVYLNTSGLGVCLRKPPLGPRALKAGDRLILSGDIGRHGAALLAARASLALESPLLSDLAYLGPPALELTEKVPGLRAMTDLTRGGLATALNEWARESGLRVEVEEGCVPICEEVNAVSQLLGLDPWTFANEGRFLLAVAPECVEETLERLRGHSLTAQSQVVGLLCDGTSQVVVRTALGTTRVCDMPVGDLLPRIC